MKIIETKAQLDACKAVAEFAGVKAFTVDALKLVSDFHRVDHENFRRANAVFNFRINNGLLTNPYVETDEMYSVYEILKEENRKAYHVDLMNYMQIDVCKDCFVFEYYYNKDSKEIVSGYKEVANNPELYPEALKK